MCGLVSSGLSLKEAFIIMVHDFSEKESFAGQVVADGHVCFSVSEILYLADKVGMFMFTKYVIKSSSEFDVSLSCIQSF